MLPAPGSRDLSPRRPRSATRATLSGLASTIDLVGTVPRSAGSDRNLLTPNVTGPGIAGFVPSTTTFGNKSDVVRAGINYRFGWDGPPVGRFRSEPADAECYRPRDRGICPLDDHVRQQERRCPGWHQLSIWLGRSPGRQVQIGTC